MACGYVCTNCGKCKEPLPSLGVCPFCKTPYTDEPVCPNCGRPKIALPGESAQTVKEQVATK